MAITMEIPVEWLAEAGLQTFKPTRSAFRCAAPHQLIALAEIEPFVHLIPLHANGFNQHKMRALLEMIREDQPCQKPIYVARQSGQWFYCLRDGVHRFYASRSLASRMFRPK